MTKKKAVLVEYLVGSLGTPKVWKACVLNEYLILMLTLMFLQPHSGLSYSAVGSSFLFSSDFCFLAMVF